MKVQNINTVEFLKRNSANVIMYLVKQQSNEKLSQKYSQEALLAYEAILSTQISPKTETIKATYFRDSIWNFSGLELNKRGTDSAYSLNWSKTKNIPEVIVFKLKLLAFYSTIDNRLLDTRKTPRKMSFDTVATKIKRMLKFFNSVFSAVVEEHGVLLAKQYTEISSIEEELLVSVAENNYWNKVGYKHTFAIFDKKIVWRKIQEEKPIGLKWANLPFKDLKKDPNYFPRKRKEQKFFEVAHFRKLTEKASFYVIDFLNSINVTPNCSLSQTMYKKAVNDKKFLASQYPIELIASTCFKTILGQSFSSSNYINHPAYRNLGMDKLFTSPSEMRGYSCLPKKYKKLGTSVEVRSYLKTVQAAALFLIGSYTGMRPDEFRQINFPDSLVEKDVGLMGKNMVFIKTTVLKARDRTGLFNDEFIAIDIVLDAMKLVEKLNELMDYKGEFCTQLAYSRIPKHSISSLNNAFSKFINDTLGYISKFSEDAPDEPIYEFYPYMLRHNFAYQLYREELSLVFISFAMKHVVHGIDRYKKSSSTTLGYGELGDRLAGTTKLSSELRKSAGMESIQNQFDPDGTYVGGGGEKWKRHLKLVFKAYIEEGYSKEELFELMWDQGYHCVNMGIAYCQAESEIEAHSALPCTGGLDCSLDCLNAVSSKEHIPRLIEINLSAVKVRNKSLESGAPLSAYKEYQVDYAIKATSCSLNKLGVEGYNGGN